MLRSKERQILALNVFIILLSNTYGLELIYKILEQRDRHFYIGNIANASNLLENASTTDRQNIRYSILAKGNPFAPYFSVNESTSDFYTNDVIDRESLPSCEFSDICELTLEIVASSQTFFYKVKVKVIIMDINDNNPYFPIDTIDLEVSEAFSVNSTLPLQGAVDLDSGINSVQSYEILDKSVPFSLRFHKNVDGRLNLMLVLTKELDRETVNSYQFLIEAKDGGDPVLSGTLFVNITVTDVNDHQPQFSQSEYYINIDEDVAINTTVFVASATDSDLGRNGEVSYRLSPNQPEEIKNIFHIDATNGNLSVIRSLIYQPGEILKVIIEASDNADQPLPSQTVVFAVVLDSTNDPPEININILSNSPTAEIPESSKEGAPVAHIGVTDDDIGANGIVNCSVENPNFELVTLETNDYKVVIAQEFDREKEDSYQVVVICQDFGSPPLTSTAEFKVTVIDVNDNSPQFQETMIYVDVYENNNIGDSLLMVTAVDNDIEKNSEIVYSLQQIRNHNIVINSDSGEIFINFRLDRETDPEIAFKIVATDKGAPPRSGIANVVVRVLDTNDNKPKFNETFFTYTIPENEPEDTWVGRVSATDLDLGNNGSIEFSVSTALYPNLPFVVHKNGSIFTKQELDREVNPHGVSFVVIASDKGTPVSLNSSVYVNVYLSDVNDNEPEFAFPSSENKTVTVIFDIPVSSIIGRVIANDRDYDMNSRIIYSFAEKNIQELFYINPQNGDISIARKLTPADVNRYPVTVIAEDQGVPKRSTNVTMTIVVISQQVAAPPSPTPHPSNNYLLIAVIISCVTVILAGLIILTIFLLRRLDNFKGDKSVVQNTSAPNDKKTMYDALELPTHHTTEQSEKRVSFQSSETSDDHLVIERSHFKNKQTPEDVEKILDQIMPPPRPSRVSQVQSLSTPPKYQRQPTSQIDKLRLHQNVIQLHSNQHFGSKGASNGHNDNDSETSMESNTSDSGRGGSESDIHSSGGLSQCQELDYLKNVYQQSDDREHHRLKQPQNRVVQLRDIKPVLKNKYSSQNFVDNKSEGNSSVNSRPSKSGKYERYDRNGLPSYSDFVSKPSVHWDPEMTDILNGSMVTIDEYDDASTTTSGSYTVDDFDQDFDIRMDCVV